MRNELVEHIKQALGSFLPCRGCCTIQAFLCTDWLRAVDASPALFTGAYARQCAIASVVTLTVLQPAWRLKCRCVWRRSSVHPSGIDSPGIVNVHARLLADGDGAIVTLPSWRAQALSKGAQVSGKVGHRQVQWCGTSDDNDDDGAQRYRVWRDAGAIVVAPSQHLVHALAVLFKPPPRRCGLPNVIRHAASVPCSSQNTTV